MKEIEKPEAGEFYPDTIKYIGLFPDDGFVLKHLADNLQATTDFIGFAAKVIHATRLCRPMCESALRCRSGS